MLSQMDGSQGLKMYSYNLGCNQQLEIVALYREKLNMMGA